jgi:hypothetical protein
MTMRDDLAAENAFIDSAHAGYQPYRVGMLPQNQNHHFPVKISWKKIGDYQVTDFSRPNTRLWHFFDSTRCRQL